MASTKISKADTTGISSLDYTKTKAYNDLTLFTDSYSVIQAGTTTELEYQMDWNSWNGYYMTVPEVGSMVDRKALWVIGKGFEADEKTKKILEKIRGNGKDTFNSIIHNGVKVYTIGGDSFAEIIKNKKGILKNLKPLNPGTIKIIANEKGMIIRYEQWTEGIVGAEEKVIFRPEEIFHLAWNRTADAIHGTPTLDKLKRTIEALQEAKYDMKVVFHRYVKPLLIISVDTDDEAEINKFKGKLDATFEKAENLVIPHETVKNIEKVSIPQFSTLDPLPWIKRLEEEFIRAEGVSSVVLGVADKEMTEASGKILYLSWQQVIEWNQLFLEEQIKAQLGLDVKFNFPASIAPELMQDIKKDGKMNKEPNLEAGKKE